MFVKMKTRLTFTNTTELMRWCIALRSEPWMDIYKVLLLKKKFINYNDKLELELS